MNNPAIKRSTGTYRILRMDGEDVRTFVPNPLPPRNPPLSLNEELHRAVQRAESAIDKLAVAANMVPNADWFLYGFVRKEALITSQIEGTQATLQDVLGFEAGERAQRPDDVQEVCNYIDALTYARKELSKPRGLPLATRLLCEAHRRLMKGVRGADKQPGEIRQSQNWIGGSRPGNARFVPPPPDAVRQAMSDMEKWIHAPDSLPAVVKIGLAHVQFETIHPFLDGNGRIGRLLVALLVEHWGLLKTPLLYISVAFKRHRQAYYEKLSAVRTVGDWESWIHFFLDCVTESAEDGVVTAQKLFTLTNSDRHLLTLNKTTSIAAIRLFERLPAQPMITLASALELLKVSKPTAIKAIKILQSVGILRETTGKHRDRVYAYRAYLKILTKDTD